MTHNTMTLEQLAEAIDATANLIEKAVEDAEGQSLVDAVKVYWRLKSGYDALDKARKRVYALADKMDKFVIPTKFEAEDLDLIRIPELARSFYPQTKYSAKVGDKEKLADWLREIGQEALITETVNSSTLAGFLKERLLEEGIDPPEDFVQLTTYKAIGSSKYTPK